MKCVRHDFLRDGFFSSPTNGIITLSHTFLALGGCFAFSVQVELKNMLESDAAMLL